MERKEGRKEGAIDYKKMARRLTTLALLIPIFAQPFVNNIFTQEVAKFMTKYDTEGEPSRLKGNGQTFEHDGRIIQIFEVKGNPKSDRQLIIVPAMKGPFHYIDMMATDPEVLDNFNRVITLSYPGQGKSTGTFSQKTMVENAQYAVDMYTKDTKGEELKTKLVCVSMGAVACSNLGGNSIDAMTYLHPMPDGRDLAKNLIDGRYNELGFDWIKEGEGSLSGPNSGISKRIQSFVLNNLWLLRYPLPTNESFSVFKYGNNSDQLGLKEPVKVYLPNEDEFGTREQLDKQFGGTSGDASKHTINNTGANSHSDIGMQKVRDIIIN